MSFEDYHMQQGKHYHNKTYNIYLKRHKCLHNTFIYYKKQDIIPIKAFLPIYFNFYPNCDTMRRADKELDYLEIGQNIRKQRLKKGLKQRELAERTNISSQHISHIETGRAQVSLPTLVAISNALQIDCNTLLGKTLTGAQNILYREKFEEIFTVMDSKKFQLCYEICRFIAEWEL